MFKICLFATALALRVLASPTALVEPVQDLRAEYWSLLNFKRVCAADQISCNYSFLVSEHASAEPKSCSFTIESDGRPAHQTSFSLAKCPEAAEYSINGGWNNLGFVTLSVINDEKSLISWFSYKDDALVSGVEAGPQQSKVYFHPIPVKRDISTRDDHESLAGASEWELENVVRYVVNQGTAKETVVLSFFIQGGDVPGEYCSLQMPVVQTDGASTKSFFGQQCQEGSPDWAVSWGHNEATDEVVMTLVNQSQRRQAWFGFNNVSTHVLLGANGPNPTKDLPQEI